MPRATKEQIDSVPEWDEYGQGYDEKANLLVCICGEWVGDGDDHNCPYNDQPENWDCAP